MTANATAVTTVATERDREQRHRGRLLRGYIAAICLIAALALYGFNYYTLGLADRPFSNKHSLLKPSGAVGVNLGILGLAMFLVIFLYPLRKRWAWLLSKGSSRHWLDFHVLLGLSAPFVIAFHASFKFRGFAGVAFWIMVAVSLSGVIGRYLYGQIPRRLNSAEVSKQELQDVQLRLSLQLREQKLLPQADLAALLRLPSPGQVAKLPLLVALGYMIVLDVLRPLRTARVRRHALTWGECLFAFGGITPTRHHELEYAIRIAREEAALSKKILFLTRSQQVFHLWHVVHRPFSYSFAVLVLIHVTVVSMMGFF